uniref:Uncharacterized protein n=1 Tax=Parastrongyloides trichosuri TaxID=131310 RepID=A0A0N4ZXN8_PARTI
MSRPQKPRSLLSPADESRIAHGAAICPVVQRQRRDPAVRRPVVPRPGAERGPDRRTTGHPHAGAGGDGAVAGGLGRRFRAAANAHRLPGTGHGGRLRRG